MILVTLGTQNQKFYRLLEAIEKLDTDEEIIVQAGGSADFVSDKMKILDFISYEEMEKYIDEASVVITHGGTGSIIMPLQKGKKVIASPRLSKYDEHINDHQMEITSVFCEQGYILEFNDGDDLQVIYEKSKSFLPKVYKSNTDKFIKQLQDEIEKPYKSYISIFWYVLLFLLVCLGIYLLFN